MGQINSHEVYLADRRSSKTGQPSLPRTVTASSLDGWTVHATARPSFHSLDGQQHCWTRHLLTTEEMEAEYGDDMDDKVEYTSIGRSAATCRDSIDPVSGYRQRRCSLRRESAPTTISVASMTAASIATFASTENDQEAEASERPRRSTLPTLVEPVDRQRTASPPARYAHMPTCCTSNSNSNSNSSSPVRTPRRIASLASSLRSVVSLRHASSLPTAAMSSSSAVSSSSPASVQPARRRPTSSIRSVASAVTALVAGKSPPTSPTAQQPHLRRCFSIASLPNCADKTNTSTSTGTLLERRMQGGRAEAASVARRGRIGLTLSIRGRTRSISGFLDLVSRAAPVRLEQRSLSLSPTASTPASSAKPKNSSSISGGIMARLPWQRGQRFSRPVTHQQTSPLCEHFDETCNAATVTTMPTAKRSVEYHWVRGRRRCCYRHGVDEMLPGDQDDIDAADHLHDILRFITRRNHFAPLQQPKRVLDVGCGSGIWMREMAAIWPRTQFLGLDLVDVFALERAPTNCQFHLGDVLNGVPRPSRHFDYIHQRLLIFHLPTARYADLFAEYHRLLRPGGHLELVECDMRLESTGPLGARLSAMLRLAGRARSVDLDQAAALEQPLQAAGLRLISGEMLRVPVGGWAGITGEMVARVLLGQICTNLEERFQQMGLLEDGCEEGKPLDVLHDLSTHDDADSACLASPTLNGEPAIERPLSPPRSIGSQHRIQWEPAARATSLTDLLARFAVEAEERQTHLLMHVYVAQKPL